jgi:outer membrane lipoprotein-sorting protein
MFRRFSRLFCIGLVICTFLQPMFVKAQVSLDSIVLNHLRATGLEKFGEELKDFAMEGQLMQNKIGFPIKIKGVIPGKYRMDMVFKQRNFVKISNGNSLWEYNPFTEATTTGKCSDSEAQVFIDRLCGSLDNYKRGTIALRFIASTTIDDIEVYKFEVKEKGQSQIYYIDKYSYLILRIDDDFAENKITYYSDYRKVGKYYLPFSLTGYENGLPVMSMKFSNIILNTGISESEFAKP